MIWIKKDIFDRIVEHSRRELHNEACGILAGSLSGEGKRAVAAYEMINAARSPESFLMDPKEQLKVLKDIRVKGFEMVGIYHSHPKTEAYPSAHDVNMAYYPDVSYIIVSLRDAKDPVVRSFTIRQGVIAEEKISLIEKMTV